MPELKAYYQPHGLAEALVLLRELGDSARPLAGGTSLVLSKSSRIDTLVDLRQLGLDRIEEKEDGLHVGAMVTCAALRRYLSKTPCSMLTEVAGAVGSRILQNQITVGGNCVMVYSWSDFPVALWCLDASFIIQGQAIRRVNASTFFAEHPLHLLQEGELLIEVVIPRSEPNTGSAYLKMGRNATDQALASVAAKVILQGDEVKQARLAVGAIRGMPQCLLASPGELHGKPPSLENLRHAARQASEEVKISGDYRATSEYRKELVRCLMEDALERAVARARGAA